MRFLLVFFTISLLSVHEPSAAYAGRYSAAAKKTTNANRARPGVRLRQMASKVARSRVRTAKARPSRFSRIGKRLRSGVALRSAVRGQRSKTKELRRAGELSGAAKEISRSPTRNAKGQFVAGAKKASMRERFAVWRSTRAVKKAALKGAKQRSKAGSIEGTADALNALKVLEGKGKLGVVGRWQKARATKKAFSNMRKNASKALKAGELELAGQNFAFAAELRGGGRQTKSMAKGLVKESFKMAQAYAKAGDGELTWNVLEMAAAIAQEGGAKFDQKKAQKVVDKAFKNALPVLTKAAEQAFKAGEVNRAVSILAEARKIESSGTAKPSRGVAKRQKKLADRLGSRLTEFEGASPAKQAELGQQAKAKELRRAGELTGAAKEISRDSFRNAKGQFLPGSRKATMRERFAVWRSTRAVKKAALKGAKERSKLGSIEGTADAVNALNVLEKKGKLGIVGRWQKARATKSAFKNMRKNAKNALRAGELEVAGQNFAFAAELRGGGRQTKSMAKSLVKESFKMAEAYAKAGDSQLTWNVLEMAAAISQAGGAKFNEKSAQKIVEKAFKNAIPVLTKGAENAFKAGEMNRAMSMLAEARAIRNTGTAKASRGVTRRQNKLAKRLGSRLLEFEAAQAEQQRQAEAEAAAN